MTNCRKSHESLSDDLSLFLLFRMPLSLNYPLFVNNACNDVCSIALALISSFHTPYSIANGENAKK